MTIQRLIRPVRNTVRVPYRKVRRIVHQRISGGGFNINICNPRNGFFAHLEWILELLAYQKITGNPVRIKLTSPQYVDPDRGTNWLDYFFAIRDEANQWVDRDVPWLTIEEIDEIALARSYDADLNFNFAHEIFFDRFVYQPAFAAEVESIAREKFGQRSVIGVHYRGTDKYTEARLLAHGPVLQAVDEQLERRHPQTRIFVATDETKFLNEAIHRYGDRVVWLPDFKRSDDGKPVHLSSQSASDGYFLGRDALLNCLMLSRCDVVIKTASILSSWAKVFNPNLEIYAMSRRRKERSYFPERCIPDYYPPDAAVSIST